MVDGTLYQTKEPEIDAVTDWLKACGKWGKVGCAVEENYAPARMHTRRLPCVG